MPVTYKTLGQVNPAATTETSLYVPTAGTAAVVSTIVICNQASSAATYRIAVVTSTSTATGAIAVAKDWVVYNATVGANDTTALTLGVTLEATKSIRVFASTANLSFSAFGSEIS